jgi:hypothetical protein
MSTFGNFGTHDQTCVPVDDSGIMMKWIDVGVRRSHAAFPRRSREDTRPYAQYNEDGRIRVKVRRFEIVARNRIVVDRAEDRRVRTQEEI